MVDSMVCSIATRLLLLLLPLAGLFGSVDGLRLHQRAKSAPLHASNHLVAAAPSKHNVLGGAGADAEVDLDLTTLVGARRSLASQQSASAATLENASEGPPPGHGLYIQNATVDGVELVCLNCHEQMFVAWLSQMFDGAFDEAVHIQAGAVGVGGKHPNAPGYDKWNKKGNKEDEEDEKKASFLGLTASNKTISEPNGTRTLEISTYSVVDIEPMKEHLKYLWKNRRLIVGAGMNPLQKPMNFVQALVSLSRKSPELLAPNCSGREREAVSLGLGNSSCDALLSGLQPVATTSDLRRSLEWTFGKDFLRQNSYEKGLSADEERRRVKSLLSALKHTYTFYHQFCLKHDVGSEKCDAKATSHILGTIACHPQDDQPTDDCMYAEVRYCAACGDKGRLFEYSRMHGPLALFGTGLTRNWVMGQCEEFSRAGYTLLAVAGWKARYVLDFTDHVWIEVWLPDGENGHKWVHADPSEGVLDSPLMYEKGWGKKLTMIFAFTPWSVDHVTATYTADYNATVQRRQVPEKLLDKILGEANTRLTSQLPIDPWGYTASATSRDRSLEEVMLWQHFEAH